ncbi:MAG: phosphotransferase enzyme family protein [Ilumatobacteraceae bacterium]
MIAAHSFNHIFRVDTADDRRYAARVGAPQRIHHEGVEALEASWTNALARAGIPVAAMISDANGRFVVDADSVLVTGRRPISLFTWVSGRPMRDEVSLDVMESVGRMMAEVHDHAAHWQPEVEVPAGVVADRVVYFLDDTLLGTYESSYGNLFREAIDRAQRVIDTLWLHPPHAPHLLHGDFGPHNIMRYRSKLTAIDFQDLRFGFDVQDVGVTVSDLGRRYADSTLVDALRRGYSLVRSWPAGDEQLIQALSAARSLNMLNLGLNLRRSRFAEFFDRHAELIGRWMSDGEQS